MRIYLLLPLLCGVIFAQQQLPSLYARLGTPLFTATKAFEKFKSLNEVHNAITEYETQAVQLIDSGIQAEKSGDRRQINAYLKSLRKLQKEHDAIAASLSRLITRAMNRNDYTRFHTLATSGYDGFYRSQSLEKDIYAYYLANRKNGKIAYLEQRIAEDRRVQKSYAQPDNPMPKSNATQERAGTGNDGVILLTTPGCGYCRKARDHLNRLGIRFTEFDIQSSAKGKSLFKRHRATGVPVLISGGDVLKGYSAGSYAQFFSK